MGKLNQWAKDASPFLKLEDGEEFSGKYMGYAFVVNQNGDEVPCYNFKTIEGKVKRLQSASKALANFFDEDNGQGKVGDTIKIKREGLQKDTTYECQVSNDVVM